VRIALDTNFLVYAEGINDPVRCDVARDITRRLPREETCLPAQALGELFNVLTRKARRNADAARAAVLGWSDTFAPIPTSYESLLSAMDLAADHQLHIWDAIILATAADAGCRLMLSEDLQDGFTWRGVSVVNPFAVTRHPLLEASLAEANPPNA
jgi:predicted nucleic acid-binding protein